MPQPTLQDRDLIRYAASFVNLRPRDLSELTGRSVKVMRRRLSKLLISRKVRFGEKRGQEETGVGYFRRLPNPENPFENVFRLSQKGWDRALTAGFISDEVNETQEKSDRQLDHDLILTDFHKALHLVFGERLHWNQLYKARYTRWGRKPEDYVNADAFFYIEQEAGSFASFFVEIENQKGVIEPMRKMDGYQRFANSGAFQEKFEADDFRTIFLKPTRDMAANLLKASSGKYATARFWISDYATAQNALAKNYLTPKDFGKTAYSLLDA